LGDSKRIRGEFGKVLRMEGGGVVEEEEWRIGLQGEEGRRGERRGEEVGMRGLFIHIHSYIHPYIYSTFPNWKDNDHQQSAPDHEGI
jgi:hypothetical protein